MLKKAKELYPGFADMAVDYNVYIKIPYLNKGNTIAYAQTNTTKKTVVFSYGLNYYDANTLDFKNNTIPHEVAHFVNRLLNPLSKPHGATWRRIMWALTDGKEEAKATSNAYTNVVNPNHIKVKKGCTCGETFTTTRRKYNNLQKKVAVGTIYICEKCGQRYTSFTLVG
jgi:predicted SprT family Zn-dependent metalloprotease